LSNTTALDCFAALRAVAACRLEMALEFAGVWVSTDGPTID